jgi:hypothetical protein
MSMFFGLCMLSLSAAFSFAAEIFGMVAMSNGSYILAGVGYILIRHALAR